MLLQGESCCSDSRQAHLTGRLCSSYVTLNESFEATNVAAAGFGAPAPPEMAFVERMTASVRDGQFLAFARARSSMWTGPRYRRVSGASTQLSEQSEQRRLFVSGATTSARSLDATELLKQCSYIAYAAAEK